MKSFKYLLAVYLIILSAISSCKKEDEFLNAKPSSGLVVPSTLDDYQLLISNDGNNRMSDPEFGLYAEEFYFAPTYFNTSAPTEAVDAYTFQKNVEYDELDWDQPYQIIHIANFVLDGISAPNFTYSDQNRFNSVKGTALFFRAWNLFNLLQIFSLPYDSSTASSDLGIPLILTSDINVKYTRASVADSYRQVLQDAQLALSLLPVTSNTLAQPNTNVVNGFLARVYLSMRDYSSAFKYADAALQQNSTITDYNTLNAGVFPFTSSVISEVTYLDNFDTLPVSLSQEQTNPDLLSRYAVNDIRRSLFFRTVSGRIFFQGNYGTPLAPSNSFSGIANDELLLDRAECYARQGNTSAAMQDLNNLLVNRWKTGTFTPYTATSATDALNQILVEREKELVFRGLRWIDIRRFSKEPDHAITITRVVNGITYTLAPGSPRYAFQIPINEINISGIQQNP